MLTTDDLKPNGTAVPHFRTGGRGTAFWFLRPMQGCGMRRLRTRYAIPLPTFHQLYKEVYP